MTGDGDDGAARGSPPSPGPRVCLVGQEWESSRPRLWQEEQEECIGELLSADPLGSRRQPLPVAASAAGTVEREREVISCVRMNDVTVESHVSGQWTYAQNDGGTALCCAQSAQEGAEGSVGIRRVGEAGLHEDANAGQAGQGCQEVVDHVPVTQPHQHVAAGEGAVGDELAHQGSRLQQEVTGALDRRSVRQQDVPGTRVDRLPVCV